MVLFVGQILDTQYFHYILPLFQDLQDLGVAE
jgi:hypothetical protein